MVWFFQKEIPLKKNTDSLVLGSPLETPEESQRTFEKLWTREADAIADTMLHRKEAGPTDFKLIPLRPVLVDGKKYFAGACAMMNTEIFGYKRNGTYGQKHKLAFFMISPDGQVQQFEFEHNLDLAYEKNIYGKNQDKEIRKLNSLKGKDGFLDINAVRKHTRNKKLAELIDKFFLITDEERSAYTSGKPYPNAYSHTNLGDYVKRRKDKQGDFCLQSYMDQKGNVHEIMITDRNLAYLKDGKWEFLEAGSAIDTENNTGMHKEEFLKNYEFCTRSVLRKMLRESSSKGEQLYIAKHLKRRTRKRDDDAFDIHRLRRDVEKYKSMVKNIGQKRKQARRSGTEM